MTPPPPDNTGKRLALFTLALFGAVVVILFLLPPDTLLGAFNGDVTKQFLSWRAFAAASLHAGHLPLWNPYTFSGQPFLGEFQSALFYPPNLLFLCLPLCRAMNLILAGHLFILGWGMYRFAIRRGLTPFAAGVCAYLLPLSGAVFPHLYAGHLPNLCSMAWTPWIFAGLEDWMTGSGTTPSKRGAWGGLLLASGAVALQIFAGHPQYVFYTAMAAGAYALARSIFDPPVRRRALPAVAAIYVAAALLAAVQLIPGMAAVSEGVRQGKLSFNWAISFSLPPENLLTLIAPGFFGTLNPFSYWGRCDLWEMSVFVGISGLVLAGIALGDAAERRAARIETGLAALCVIVALGVHTPVFRLLYDVVPGFGRFRGVSKFIFPALFFLVLTIGRGVDVLRRGGIPRRWLAIGLLAAGVAAAVAGGFLRANPGSLGGAITRVEKSGEGFLSTNIFEDPQFRRDAGLQAGFSLLMAGGILVVIGGCLAGARRRPLLRWVPLVLLPLEMLGFAKSNFAFSNYADAAPDLLVKFVAAHPGDYRVFDNAVTPNNGFLLGVPDISGIDPGPLKRYAEFITYAQGNNPDEVTQDLSMHKFPLVFSMLRFSYLFHFNDSGTLDVATFGRAPMAWVQLLSDYRVLPGRDAIFTALLRPDFDPRRTVLLESEPSPRPESGGEAGRVRVVASSGDSLTIEADTPRSALLLVTDPYSRDWVATPLPGSVQSRYQILPANYILRAVPLQAGHHLIRMDYRPTGLGVGAAISILAWLVWLTAVARLRFKASSDNYSNP